MNLSTLARDFNTQQKCIEYLEELRWGDEVVSPFTGQSNVTRRKGSNRFHDNGTNRDFTVLYDTIFEDTRLPLPTWFQLIWIMGNAKKGISSAQLARTLGIGYPTAWYASMRLRCAMIDKDMKLDGMVEMDESYLGGRPRRKSPAANHPYLAKVDNKRGRGTRKVPVVGIVERKGKVVTKVIEKLSGRNLLAMLKHYVNTDKSIAVTDEFSSYKALDDHIEHLSINHSREFSRGIVHVNTIEGFWSIVKNGIKGNYMAVSKKYLPFYMLEFQFKYNNRDKTSEEIFKLLLTKAVSVDKHFIHYQPTEDVKKLVYG